MEKIFVKGNVDLNFNPSSPYTPELLQAIFLDDSARNLWLGIKQKHITNQYFNKHCIKAAWKIKKEGFPTTPEELHNILGNTFGAPEYDLRLSEQLLPYLITSRNIEYTVNKPLN